MRIIRRRRLFGTFSNVERPGKTHGTRRNMEENMLGLGLGIYTDYLKIIK